MHRLAGTVRLCNFFFQAMPKQRSCTPVGLDGDKVFATES